LTYEFRCSCGWRGEQSCPIDERDEQVCPECRKAPKRLIGKAQICIPAAFAITGDPCQPRNAEEKARWDRDGVSLVKGGRWI